MHRSTSRHGIQHKGGVAVLLDVAPPSLSSGTRRSSHPASGSSSTVVPGDSGAGIEAIPSRAVPTARSDEPASGLGIGAACGISASCYIAATGQFQAIDLRHWTLETHFRAHSSDVLIASNQTDVRQPRDQSRGRCEIAAPTVLLQLHPQ